FPMCVLLSVLTGTLPSPTWAQDVPFTSSETRKPVSWHAFEQDAKGPYELQPGEDPENRLVSPFVKHLGRDQKSFWSTPVRLRTKGLLWIMPMIAATGTAVAADSWISRQVPDSPSQLRRSRQVSDYATYSLIGASGGAFLLGHLTHNEHLRETGFLA